MIDAHCHLYEFSDIGAEIQRFKEIGGTDIICCGGGIESSKKAIEIAEKYPEVWATVGIHPEEMTKSQIPDPNELLKLTNNQKVIAIGECGLDYTDQTTDQNKEDQKQLLKFNLDLAKKTKLPLIVHCRNAFADLFEIFDESHPFRVQMHCFTGNQAQAEECLRRGWYISFGGILTFKSSHSLREVAKLVLEDKLLIETDSPYLAPEPIRGTRNTPQNVKIVAETLAQVRGVTVSEIDRITCENARRLFNLHVEEKIT